MKIELARLYARQRRDGATTLSGRVGYNGRLRIEPNPNKVEGDDKSPDFIATIEERPDDGAAPYKGAQLVPARPMRPSAPPAFVEGEVIDADF
jgi:hypothetical protein